MLVPSALSVPRAGSDLHALRPQASAEARSQRRPLQFTPLAKPWGEFEGGDSRVPLSTRPPGRANQSQNSLNISVWFLVTFWKVSGCILGLIFNDFPALFLIKTVIYFSIEFSSIFGWDLGA